MSISTTFKPSPLSFGSPRTSPFRRPESPASPSTVRATTPTPSPTKVQTPTQHTPTPGPGVTSSRTAVHTNIGDAFGSPTRPALAAAGTPSSTNLAHKNIGETSGSPVRPALAAIRGDSWIRNASKDGNDALSRLDPAQIRELREAFQMLDRDSDGLVGREDVASILNDLGQESSASIVDTFFSTSTSQGLTLPEFLTQLSTLLSAMSRPDELTSAFSAFDDEDNGQIDIVELREALLSTNHELGAQRPLSEREIEKVMSGFTGRKTLGRRGLGQGEVFRYQEFMAAVTGVAEKPDNSRR